MACIPCQAAARARIAAAEAASAKPSEQQDLMARPKAPWLPPIYRFRDELDPPNDFQDLQLNTLLARVIQFRHENKLADIPYLAQIVIHQTMLSDPIYEQHIEWYVPDVQVQLSAKQYILAGLMFLSAQATPDAQLYVDQEVAEARALVCVNCPRNVPKVNGRTVEDPGLAQSKFVQLSKGRTTSVDGMLGLCGVCTCVLKAKVHFDGKFVRSSSTKELLQQFTQEYVGRNGKPMHCWIADLDKETDGDK